MMQNENIGLTTNLDDEDSLRDFLEIFLSKKFFIGGLTIFFAIISLLYSLSLPNMYSSSALLMTVDENDSMTSGLGAYSDIVGFAGVSILDDRKKKSAEAISRINSLDFFKNHFLPNIKLENLMAVESWDKKSNNIIYDSSKFDSKNSKWRSIDKDKNKRPSTQKAYRANRQIVEINEDSKTKFVRISITHQSPEVASVWLETIIENINLSMKNEDISLAKKSIEFLNQASETTNVKDIQEAISDLLVNQMQTLMLASASDEYVYKTIDSPYVPELKSSPSRFLICFFGTFLGLIISILLVLIIHLLTNHKRKS